MRDRTAAPQGGLPPEEGGGLVVTESMARLYLRQGHKAQALAIYRRLLERSPGSATLQEALRQLEAELETGREARDTAPPAAKPRGPDVRSWLGEILHAPLPKALP